MTNYTHLTECRCCGSTNLKSYLNLGLMPMANDLQLTQQEAKDIARFPLEVLFCEDCSLSQLSIVVDPVVMFSNYVYRSSINKGYVEHCRQMAWELQQKHNLTNKSFIIDIAGNDGALLKEFNDVIKPWKSLNIDPAKNMVPINEVNDVRQFCAFWGMPAAKQLVQMGWPKADLITATNVFAHVHDVKDFLRAAEFALTDTGVLVLEFPYLIDFIEKNEFDTVYFEHLSYFAITPLMWLVTDCGLKIVSVSKQDIHGGTVRVTITKQWAAIPVEQSVDDFVTNENEQGYNTFDRYLSFTGAVDKAVVKFREGVLNACGNIAAFAASAKGNTLLNKAGITNEDLLYIIDETPEKIGKYSPGTGIPVLPMSVLVSDPPEYLIILSWNFADDIMNKCRAAGYVGKFVLPIPEWRVIE